MSSNTIGSASIAVRLREIKQKYGFSPHFEVKWAQVSSAKKELYLDLVDYFFDANAPQGRVIAERARENLLRVGRFDFLDVG